MRWLAIAVLLLSGCGARSALDDDPPDEGSSRPSGPEACNGLDDDLDMIVDEPWRDEIGRYIDDEHCGACDAACQVTRAGEIAVACRLIEERPLCAATECEPGLAVSISGRCTPAFERLCFACQADSDCGDVATARCLDIGSESVCTVGCEGGCPEGYACDEGLCLPEGGSCTCSLGNDFDLACAIVLPDDERCFGSARCEMGVLSECLAPEEACDERDNDCDGNLDEGFRDARGAYSLDVHNCGSCGVDCTTSVIEEGSLVCGGDPFAPTCVLDCPDAHDGIQPGDRIDADLDIPNGCECTVQALEDEAGPVLAVGQELDPNCDGADGVVVRSVYVATDGDDTNPGSPTRPLRTVGAALALASASIGTDDARPHVFIASGSYVESIEVPNGVRVHGGYRRDFLALDPTGFRVEVRAPADSTAPYGAAIVVRGAGTSETILEWFDARGLDAEDASQPAFGAYLLDPGPGLTMRDMQIRSGVAGAGAPGRDGSAGSAASTPAAQGGIPTGAEEDLGHRCSADESNVAGGSGAVNSCGGSDTSGGRGGTSACPSFARQQAAGERGRGAAGGAGGAGGMDSQGPIMGSSCDRRVCCGLADFSVPTEFTGPQPGETGGDGNRGAPGRGCGEALGRFDGDTWVPDVATGGTSGTAGSGGGGGGSGGGVEMEWFDGECEFADGLGGGGGGGGAGGCGGGGGLFGTSGGPSVALLIRYTSPPARAPSLSGLSLGPSDGGRGGDGGAGGDGGLGSAGAFGVEVPFAARSTPTLAGPFAGGRGGRGGDGGAGGGGGGGCGGSSVGVWVTGTPGGVSMDAIRTDNDFRLGRGGEGGRGGGGEAAAARGRDGEAIDVVVR